MSEQHWTVGETTYRIPRDHKPVLALNYDPTPGGRKNGDGTTSYSLVFPALMLTDIVSDPADVANKLAAELNSHPTIIAERDRMATVLKHIVDCYGVGSTPEKFCEYVHDFIMQGRQLLADSGHALLSKGQPDVPK